MIPPRRFSLILAFSLALHLFVIVPLLVASLREKETSMAVAALRPIRVRVVSGPRQTSTARQVGAVPRSSGAPNHAAVSSPAVARRRGVRDREARQIRPHVRRSRWVNANGEIRNDRRKEAVPPVPPQPARMPRAATRPPHKGVEPVSPRVSTPAAKVEPGSGARFAGESFPVPRHEQAVSSDSSGIRVSQRATLPELGDERSYPAPTQDRVNDGDAGRETREREARLQGEREAAAREAAEREAAQREQRLGEERARLNRERQEQERPDRERQEREKREREERERREREEREARERRERERKERQAREERERAQREREQREREQREREAREASRPKGPTRDAQIVTDPRPKISEEMLESASRRSVTVRFHISISGDAHASLVRSSGSSVVDARVLASCNRWRFRPALRNGEPYASTLRVRVDF